MLVDATVSDISIAVIIEACQLFNNVCRCYFVWNINLFWLFSSLRHLACACGSSGLLNLSGVTELLVFKAACLSCGTVFRLRLCSICQPASL